MPIALLRELSPRIAEAELTYLEREPIDVRRARRQHEQYERWLQDHGCTIVHAEAAPDLPDGVFVEDAAIVLANLAIITRPGAPSRQPETGSVARALERYRPLAFIKAPATIDGGDVLVIGETLYVGRSRRTNDEAIEQLRSIASRVVPVTFSGCLHLKSAVTQIATDTLLVNPAFVAPDLFQMNVIAVDPSEPHAANALRLGDTVLMPAEFPRTRKLLSRFNVETVETSELQKAEAGVTCCSVIFEVSGSFAVCAAQDDTHY